MYQLSFSSRGKKKGGGKDIFKTSPTLCSEIGGRVRFDNTAAEPTQQSPYSDHFRTIREGYRDGKISSVSPRVGFTCKPAALSPVAHHSSRGPHYGRPWGPNHGCPQSPRLRSGEWGSGNQVSLPFPQLTHPPIHTSAYTETRRHANTYTRVHVYTHRAGIEQPGFEILFQLGRGVYENWIF